MHNTECNEIDTADSQHNQGVSIVQLRPDHCHVTPMPGHCRTSSINLHKSNSNTVSCTAQAPMQLNYPGQSTVMPSNMQMRLGGQDMGYSTQAMSGMWSTRYGQSQIMQTPQAPGGQRGRPTAGRRRPGPNRHVSFTDDVQHQEIQKSAPISVAYE